MPLLRKKRVLAVKIEATAGTAETLANADVILDAYECVAQPTIATEARQNQGSFDKLPAVPGARMGTISFKVPLTIGTALPSYAARCFPGCGLVPSTNVFQPSSEAPGTNVKNVTAALYEDGLRKQIHGAAGNVRLVAPSGRMAYLEFEFQGAWDSVTDQALLTVPESTVKPLRFASGTATYNGVAQKVEQVTLDMGNTITPREDPSRASGYFGALITDRNPTLVANPEASLVATEDPYGDWIGCTEAAWALTLNGASSSSVAIAIPRAQIMNAQEGERSGLDINDITWNANRNGANNDQDVSITYTLET
ncbi:MAG: hypothetical protein AAFU85_02115 [Planctomycetota bacterium]